MRTSMTIRGIPAGIDAAAYDVPVSIMLGIRRYTAQEVADFSGYTSNAGALSEAGNEATRVEDEVFEQLDAILKGQSIKVPHNMGYSLAQRPDRLTPFAEPMASLFIAIYEVRRAKRPYRGDELQTLATAIPALPPSAFAKVADRLLVEARSDKFWDHHPAVYLRVADAGPSALPLFREHFMTEKVRGYLDVLPILAICRIGQADRDLIDKLKEDFASVDLDARGKRSDLRREALFVTLLKLGETDFVTGRYRDGEPRNLDWYEAVLSGKGLTEIGPNNCAASSWPVTTYLAPIMAPSLKRRQGWVIN